MWPENEVSSFFLAWNCTGTSHPSCEVKLCESEEDGCLGEGDKAARRAIWHRVRQERRLIKRTILLTSTSSFALMSALSSLSRSFVISSLICGGIMTRAGQLRDNCQTWFEPKVIADIKGLQVAGPSVSQDSDGTLWVVWQQELPGKRDRDMRIPPLNRAELLAKGR
jgi:hypothetical protein